MREKKPQKVRAHFRLSPKIREQLEQHSKETGLTMTVIVEIAAAEYLRKHNRQAA